MADRPRELTYVGDPMCSWCWGFAPVLNDLQRVFADRVTFRLKVGGLRPGSKSPMDHHFARYLRHHWDEVKEFTGQLFNFSILELNDFVYDTEPACRAVLSVRELNPHKTFVFFEMLQQSFYIGSRNITRPDVLADVAAHAGIDRHAFENCFNSRTAVVKTYNEFLEVRKQGVQGFPSLISLEKKYPDFLARSYEPFSSLETKIEQWLNAE
jgi:putative protein-disulfide isomerase